MSESVVAPIFSKDNPFPAKITENRLLNKPGSSKETRHLIVDLADSDLTYKAGDSLGICPTNREIDVATILTRLRATGDELVSPAMLRLAEPIPFRDALLHRLSLGSPTLKLVQLLAAKVTDAAEKTKLDELLTPESKEVLATFLADREYADLLNEFPSATITPQELVDLMRKLMPRLYSVASSAKVHPRHVHLTVAVVRYRTNDIDRVGVCSGYLAERVQVNDTLVPVFVSNSNFGPPQDGAADCIMVGPGTGIAPFRAFMQERVASGDTGRNWIFFGDQKSHTDYLYEEEWNDYLAKGQLHRLDLAWSRDQEVKVYVQDKMRANAAEIWAWINGGGFFYVCGDAKRMAKDVDAALHEIVAEHGKMTAEEATAFLRQLRKDKRYQRDVY